MKHKRGQNSPVLVKDEMGIEIDDDPMLEMSTIKGTYCLKMSIEYKPKYWSDISQIPSYLIGSLRDLFFN
jgi:hypothetical protein